MAVVAVIRQTLKLENNDNIQQTPKLKFKSIIKKQNTHQISSVVFNDGDR